ncbi:DUF3127 domain-containing protein [Cytophagales bacterium LB-30]|uniref:DUF3127 domain-containing protein n=1 Tax=Shiella aurantiaca TaxID=3058365 RepID=A0ABT8F8H4_9BACT|nr:DUF3127 domain-containing protein [Shiella aurantiaca]MDN4166544.1 DUF3127 domain-containing protein [Shiella aurantiaca]
MEVTGKVLQLLPLQTGQGKNGPWKKQEFIIETPGQYPKKVCIALWGDKVDQNPLQIGEQVTVSMDVESREYNGRWYTEVKAWKVAKGNAAPAGDPFNQEGPDFSFDQSSDSDVLPF